MGKGKAKGTRRKNIKNQKCETLSPNPSQVSRCKTGHPATTHPTPNFHKPANSRQSSTFNTTQNKRRGTKGKGKKPGNKKKETKKGKHPPTQNAKREKETEKGKWAQAPTIKQITS